jgi:site-specific DNA-methyltransferase (adenine-specific)
MRSVPIPTLYVAENRQRREFSETEMIDLKWSILRFGLMHPIVVRTLPTGDPQLVAGERRLRVIKEIHADGDELVFNGQVVEKGYVPVVDLGELTPLEAEEAELEENIRRKDLTWQEQAAALQRLDALRRQQNPEHTVQDTAEEVLGRGDGDYGNRVRKAIIVAKHLGDEDVAKAKTADEAFKILKKKEQAARHEALAHQVGTTFSNADHTLLRGDSIALLSEWVDEPFDVILTDPPYGMGADEFGDSAGMVLPDAHEYDDSDETFTRLMQGLFACMNTITKPQAHAYIFCDIDKFPVLKYYFEQIGWKPFRTPLIWAKTTGRVPLPQHGPRRQWEAICYAFRGDKPVVEIKPDVLTYPSDPNMGHGAQKPVLLYQDLLRRSIQPGNRVLDPFCGTGTIFPAAHNLRVYATGIELSDAYAGIAAKRLSEII